MRSLFIYWKLPRRHLAGACAAVQAFQVQWCSRGVHAELHLRADGAVGAGDPATLMETYAAEGGLTEATERLLIDESAAALAQWAEGPRHVEVFSRCPR